MGDQAPLPHGGKVYLDTPYVLVGWDGDGPWVFVKWKAWANSIEYRAAQEAVILALRENHASRNLIDSRDSRVVSDEDQEWLVEDWMPRAVAAGRRWTAIVLPKSALGRTIAENIDKRPRSSLVKVEHFQTVEEAAAWLSTV
jgi:FAD/FMN-containing dehydrogenase